MIALALVLNVGCRDNSEAEAAKERRLEAIEERLEKVEALSELKNTTEQLSARTDQLKRELDQVFENLNALNSAKAPDKTKAKHADIVKFVSDTHFRLVLPRKPSQR